MSSTVVGSATSKEMAELGVIDMGLELVTLPVPRQGRSSFTYVSFSDPDGNSWLLQEITTRLPGREWDE